MRRNNITKSILSTSSPGTHLVQGNDALARRLTREVNEYAAGLKRQYPEQFGFWAALPLPDIEGSLAEIDYALDALNADGFQIMSNSHGIYLGDAVLRPVLAKLHQRKATIFVHPTAPCNHHIGVQPTPAQRVLASAPLCDAYIIPMMEFFFDTTRTFVDLILSGTAAHFSDITFVVAHCGAALPALLDRMVRFSPFNPPEFPARDSVPCTAAGVRALFARQFYFDLAGNAVPNQLDALLHWVDCSRLLYGSDVPWTAMDAASAVAAELDVTLPALFDERQIAAIYHGNAERLLAPAKRIAPVNEARL